jgi:hypothetical protein
LGAVLRAVASSSENGKKSPLERYYGISKRSDKVVVASIRRARAYLAIKLDLVKTEISACVKDDADLCGCFCFISA